MKNNIGMISVCLVVYNEEKIIERCLDSIKDLADEIILVHDGECTDRTLEIARKYTDKIFIRLHKGDSSMHRVFTYNEASGQWIFQIDADEYIDKESQIKIKELASKYADTNVNGFKFQWEMWDGKKAYRVKGFQKECFFKKDHFHYLAITHGWAYIDGIIKDSGLVLHHRPEYSNLAWRASFRKTKKWTSIHAQFYFPDLVVYEGFNIKPDKWISFTEKVRQRALFYLVFEPTKMLFGQLKNGLYTSIVGWKAALQHSIYYLILYWKVWRLKKKLKSH